MINTIASAVDAATNSQAARAKTSLADNFDNFLTLLTTQLKNQDPLKPMDSSEFTQQLVQFSGVEQAISTNKNLEKLLALVGTTSAANMVNYLGKSVAVESDTTDLKAGKAEWTYNLPAESTETVLKVFDANDRLVWSADAATAAGNYSLPWNGLNSAGQAMPDGAYKLVVEAKDAAGQPIKSRIVVHGIVTGVETTPDATMINVNGRNVPLEKILSVRVAQPAPTA
jgi:flagellar basal-body rod modification protein FlgD